MAAHLNGQLSNTSSIANSLGISQPTVTRWLDQMTQALLLRRLEPFHANLGKRLVKSPKINVRDSGLLPPDAQVSFYRTAVGSELDLLVERGSCRLGFEIRFSSAPQVTRGFWQTCQDLGLEQACIVAPVEEGWAMKSPAKCQVRVLGPTELQAALKAHL